MCNTEWYMLADTCILNFCHVRRLNVDKKNILMNLKKLQGLSMESKKALFNTFFELILKISPIHICH